MAFINIPVKDNTTPFTPTEFNYLVNKLNTRQLKDLIDVQDTDAIDKNIIRHNGSGWVYYTIENDFYTKYDINQMFGISTAGVTPTFEATWGGITGTIRAQSDLVDNFGDLKSPSNIWLGEHYSKNYILEGSTSSASGVTGGSITSSTFDINSGKLTIAQSASTNVISNTFDGRYSLLSQVLTDVPSGALFTDTIYSHPANHAISVITGLQDALDDKIETSLIGAANGLAELNANGFVKNTQLPSYVDDVIEGTYINTTTFNDLASTPAAVTGEAGKIYVDTTSNKTYRWSGTIFATISETIALGETSSTAYRGDRGKIAYDHSLTTHAPSDANNYTLPFTDNSANWNTAYAERISSLTVTGASGAATLVSNVLNIPTYTLSGLGYTTPSLQDVTDVNTTTTTGAEFGDDVTAPNFMLTGSSSTASQTATAWSLLTGSPTDNVAFNTWASTFSSGGGTWDLKYNGLVGKTVNGGIVNFTSGSNITTSFSGDTITSTLNSSISITGNASFGGSVKVGDDSTAASAANVGSTRYNTVGNNSYTDMCMQTGAATYAWINIVQNNW